MPYFFVSRSACVPLPAPGGPIRISQRVLFDADRVEPGFFGQFGLRQIAPANPAQGLQPVVAGQHPIPRVQIFHRDLAPLGLDHRPQRETGHDLFDI